MRKKGLGGCFPPKHKERAAGASPAGSTHNVFAQGLPRCKTTGMQALSGVDHSAILTCINPKVQLSTIEHQAQHGAFSDIDWHAMP